MTVPEHLEDKLVEQGSDGEELASREWLALLVELNVVQNAETTQEYRSRWMDNEHRDFGQ